MKRSTGPKILQPLWTIKFPSNPSSIGNTHSRKGPEESARNVDARPGKDGHWSGSERDWKEFVDAGNWGGGQC